MTHDFIKERVLDGCLGDVVEQRIIMQHEGNEHLYLIRPHQTMGLLRIFIGPWAYSEICSPREGTSSLMLNVRSKLDLKVVVSEKT